MEKIVPEDLLPTIENTSRIFITDIMPVILYDDNYANFNFNFEEKEAIEYIKEIISKLKKPNPELLKMIDNLENKKVNNIKPTIIVRDYKTFFNLLKKIHSKSIDLYFRNVVYFDRTYPSYEIKNYFKNIWLRMMPEDFNDPNMFLNKQVSMLVDESLSNYDYETYFGLIKCFDNNILTVRNKTADNWDEDSHEFEIRIYDKNHYSSTDYTSEYIALPLIRYGIYMKNGKRVCHIGSIQNKDIYSNKDGKIHKYIERQKYKLNSNVEEQYIEKVEPKSLLALSIFIDILNKEGIYDIEVQGMFVLDYEYHRKASKKMISDFKTKWSSELKTEYPRFYNEDRDNLKKVYKKHSLISELKTERLIKVFERLMLHYDCFEVISYPGEVDNMLHLKFDHFDSNNINNETLKQINSGIDFQYKIKKLYR